MCVTKLHNKKLCTKGKSSHRLTKECIPNMQVWNIQLEQLDIEKERLDLSRFRKEFIEF